MASSYSLYQINHEPPTREQNYDAIEHLVNNLKEMELEPGSNYANGTLKLQLMLQRTQFRQW